MAVLTWRNVDAPSFAPAMQAQNNAAQLLSSAFGGLREGLTDFQNDPIARSNALLANAIKDQQLSENQYTFGRTQESNRVTDAAAPILNQAALLNQQGRPEQAAALLQANVDKIGALRPDQVNTAITAGQNAASTGLRYTGDLFDLGSRMRSSNISDKTKVFVSNLNQFANNPVGAAAYLEANKPMMNELEYAEAQAAVGKMYPGLFGNTAGSATTTTAGAAPSAGAAISGAVGGAGTAKGSRYDTYIGYGSFGVSDTPLTQMTVGEATKFGRDVLIPATRNNAQLGLAGTNKGTSAMGAYQFTAETLDTFAPKVLGENWKNTVMTPEVQDKLGKAIFDSRKSGNLKDTWSSLTNTKPGAYANMPWEQFKELVQESEVGAAQPLDIAATRRTTENAVLDLASQRNQQSGTVADKFIQTVGDQRFVSEVIPELKKNTSFAKVPDGVITGMLNRIIERSRESGGQAVNAATAAQILLASTDKADDDGGLPSPRRIARNYEQWIRGVIPGGKGFDDFTPNLAGGIRINDDKVDANIALATSGALGDIALSQKSKVANAAKLNEYQTQLDQQEALYKDTLLRSESLPGLRSQLPAIQARIVTLNNQLRALQSAVPNTRAAPKSTAKSAVPSPDRLNELLSRFSQ